MSYAAPATTDPDRPDPQIGRLLRMLRAGAPADWRRASAAQRRASFETLSRFAASPPPGVEAEDRLAGDLRLRLYRPQLVAGRTAGLVWFHGGGLVAGSLESYDALCRTLCAGLGCTVVAVEYRLAPEHPYPAALDDAAAATEHVLDRADAFGLDPTRIALGGDSAGATLVAATLQALRDRGDARVAAQVLLCPVLDFGEDWPSKRAYGDGFLLDAAMMTRDLDHYAPTVSFDHPRVSPLRGDLRGLPPALIHTAACDPLRDEGRAYAEKLRAAGVSAAYRCHSGMVHHFHGLTSFVPAAREALTMFIGDARATLSPAGGEMTSR